MTNPLIVNGFTFIYTYCGTEVILPRLAMLPFDAGSIREDGSRSIETVQYEHVTQPMRVYSDGISVWKMAVFLEDHVIALPMTGGPPAHMSLERVAAIAELGPWRLDIKLRPTEVLDNTHHLYAVLYHDAMAVLASSRAVSSAIVRSVVSAESIVRICAEDLFNSLFITLQGSIRDTSSHEVRTQMMAGERWLQLIRPALVQYWGDEAREGASLLEIIPQMALNQLGEECISSAVQSREELRDARFKVLRKEGHTLLEINQMLEQEGFEEITQGGGLLCLPTKQHKLCWNAKSIQKHVREANPNESSVS